MADVDKALVEEVARAMHEAPDVENHEWDTDMCRAQWEYGGSCYELWTDQARVALAHLAATGRLVGEGEEWVEWELFDPKYAVWKRTSAQTAAAAPRLSWRRRSRTVRTWTTPDGATGTLVGPWVEVEG